MRVATLNLLHSTEYLEERVEHLIRLLADERLDFLCLQEVLSEEAAGFDVIWRISDALGLPYTEYASAGGRKDGIATLSRYPLSKPVEGPVNWGEPFLVTESVIGGRGVYVMNMHGAWGRKNAERLRQTLYADELAHEFFGTPVRRETRPVIILAGDLNAVPQAENIRYLLGYDSVGDRSTLWVDAWEVADPDAPSDTSGEPSHLARSTAANFRFGTYRPGVLPRRRIDYIFVYEWAWGQAGYPLSTRRIATETFTASDGEELTVSDHFGLLTELFMPDEA